MSELQIDGPRGCTKKELKKLIQLVNSIFRPDGKQNILSDYPLVYRDENLANIRLLKISGQLVSEVPFIPWTVQHKECRFTIGVISPTATHPDHRHRGFGLKCLNSCIECMQQQGIDLSVLWTQIKTFKFYNHASYQAVRDQGYTFSCAKADTKRFESHGENIVTHQPGDPRFLQKIQSMREAESCGFVRASAQVAELYSLPGLTTRVALREGQPVAYLSISSSTNKPGIIEAAGDAKALETLVYQTLGQLSDDKPVLVHTSLCPTTLYNLMQRKLPDRRRSSGENQMLRINDIPGFLGKIVPWLERRIYEDNTEFSIGIRDTGQTVSFEFSKAGLKIAGRRLSQHLELSRMDLTSVIFGAHPERPFDPPDLLERLFPFYFPISVLDRS